MPKWKRARSLPRRWQKNHLINKYGTICYLCQKEMTVQEMTIDHEIPMSLGGPDTLDNYRLAHSSCNHLKNNLNLEEFLAFQAGSIQRG